MRNTVPSPDLGSPSDPVRQWSEPPRPGSRRAVAYPWPPRSLRFPVAARPLVWSRDRHL